MDLPQIKQGSFYTKDSAADMAAVLGSNLENGFNGNPHSTVHIWDVCELLFPHIKMLNEVRAELFTHWKQSGRCNKK